jgi:hypothetical protein
MLIHLEKQQQVKFLLQLNELVVRHRRLNEQLKEIQQHRERHAKFE